MSDKFADTYAVTATTAPGGTGGGGLGGGGLGGGGSAAQATVMPSGTDMSAYIVRIWQGELGDKHSGCCTAAM